MNRKRIYKDRLYVIALPQGISGFCRPSVPAIVTGHVKKRDLLPDWGGKLDVNTAQFRMNNGRCPEYQPVGGISEVTEFLKENPFSSAVAITTGYEAEQDA